MTLNAKKRILLVEDYPANILVAGTLLEQFGYDYDVVNTGLEALKKFEEQRYDLILMDVQMHGMTGLEATQRIREMEEQRGLSRTPIMAMTAHAQMKDREKCLDAGMDDYVSKPFNTDEWSDKLRTLTKRSD